MSGPDADQLRDKETNVQHRAATVSKIDEAVDLLTLGTISTAADLLGLSTSLLLEALLSAPD